jgi:hypothetical protein
LIIEGDRYKRKKQKEKSLVLAEISLLGAGLPI